MSTKYFQPRNSYEYGKVYKNFKKCTLGEESLDKAKGVNDLGLELSHDEDNEEEQEELCKTKLRQAWLM
jgi:hypothetical protein